MRDLETDLNCVTGPVGIMKIKELYAIAEHALNRAITAEAEVERLKLMVKSITGGLDEAIETNRYLESELVKYNLAFKLACKSLDETQKNYLTPGGWLLETTFLKEAEIELDKEGER